MEIGLINESNLEFFQTLILPETVSAIKRGEAILALGLTENELAIGALTGYISGYEFVITSVYVAPDYRHMGGGTMLFDTLDECLEGKTYVRSISFVASSDEQLALADLLSYLGYRKEIPEISSAYSVTLKELFSYPMFMKDVSYNLNYFDEVNDMLLKKTTARALTQSIPLPEGGLLADSIDKSASTLKVKNNEVEAFLVLENHIPGVLLLSAVWNTGNDFTVFLKMLQTSAMVVKKKYSPDTKLVMQVISEESYALMKHLIPGIQCISYSFRKG